MGVGVRVRVEDRVRVIPGTPGGPCKPCLPFRPGTPPGPITPLAPPFPAYPFGPIRPGTPCEPFHPLFPIRPVGPMRPGRPFRPGAPGAPLAPSFPGRPGGPCVVGGCICVCVCVCVVCRMKPAHMRIPEIHQPHLIHPRSEPTPKISEPTPRYRNTLASPCIPSKPLHVSQNHQHNLVRESPKQHPTSTPTIKSQTFNLI